MIETIMKATAGIAFAYITLVGIIGITKFILIDNTAWKGAAIVMVSTIVISLVLAQAGIVLGI